ncbi:hypothetical protein CCZ01_01970 [Helicobacter monodelphidis]|uniref:DUF3972 domain-containing protein n=1 Tax=Helicobacter sp. 15-1451 TaxID=2004995 RepID=UPI000DCC722B|nr:DUF3972 domain-containing protein [Helicobacter sp. 15-1451]RAX58574.1 hypothetical protein CCZ01_01970 [Helicobacter sp. 15-1451]
MENWLKIDDFCEATNLKRELVEKLIADKKLKSREENGVILVDATSSTNAIIKKEDVDVPVLSQETNAHIAFAEKTIGTILNLHEKVLEAKDDSIASLKDENKFLKDALYSMQELYDDDQKGAQFLREQLARSQEELETLKRKYRLMWGRAGDKVELSPLVKDESKKPDSQSQEEEDAK